jgi:hypothetical protein
MTKNAVAALLADFEAVLQKTHPTRLSKLKKPQPARVSKAKLDGALADLYRWRDGGAEFLDLDDGALDWLPLSSSLAERKRLLGLRPDFKPTWYPIFTDGAGNFIALDTASGALIDFDHERTKHGRFAASLAAALRSQLTRAKKGAWHGESGAKSGKVSTTAIAHAEKGRWDEALRVVGRLCGRQWSTLHTTLETMVGRKLVPPKATLELEEFWSLYGMSARAVGDVKGSKLAAQKLARRRYGGGDGWLVHGKWLLERGEGAAAKEALARAVKLDGSVAREVQVALQRSPR